MERGGWVSPAAPRWQVCRPRAPRPGDPADDPLLHAEEILLTGSGGPFRGRGPDELGGVTASQALQHPNWVMGPKVTIDSATLMNKGLEVIEAHELFGVPYDAVRVVVHPQSIVHSLVRFSDGAVLAHLGVPDMRTPIGYALSWPDRAPLPMVPALDLFAAELTFAAPDTETFRCLALARAAGEAGARAWAGSTPGDGGGGAGAAAPIALNAANEVAVQAFLDGRIGFLAIAEVVERVLEGWAMAVSLASTTSSTATRWRGARRRRSSPPRADLAAGLRHLRGVRRGAGARRPAAPSVARCVDERLDGNDTVRARRADRCGHGLRAGAHVSAGRPTEGDLTREVAQERRRCTGHE